MHFNLASRFSFLQNDFFVDTEYLLLIVKEHKRPNSRFFKMAALRVNKLKHAFGKFQQEELIVHTIKFRS